MARAKVTHSTNACTIIFEGDPASPEPEHGIIKFPGGHVEVARTSDGSYWCHLRRDSDADAFEVVGSRIDYDHGIPSIGVPDIDEDHLCTGLSLRIGRVG